MRALPIALLTVLALTGCGAVSAPASGLTDEQLEQYYATRADTDWANTGLPDGMRPPVPEVQVVTSNEWAETLADCMNSAGYDNYSEVGGSFGSEYVQRPTTEAQAELATLYGCRNSVRLEDQESYLFNPDQIDYLYDYYKDVLVPCLEVHYVDVYDEPTRSWFVESNGGWNPYFNISTVSYPILAEGTVLADCPSAPPGMEDIGLTPEMFEE